MSSRVDFTAAAAKQIRKLQRPARERLLDAIEDLQDEPRPHGARKLVGDAIAWRIQVGDYRVIYEGVGENLVITMIRAAHRRDVYLWSTEPVPGLGFAGLFSCQVAGCVMLSRLAPALRSARGGQDGSGVLYPARTLIS